MPDCPASEFVRAIHEPGERGELTCDLLADHEELHYDATDNIAWKVGEPDA